MDDLNSIMNNLGNPLAHSEPIVCEECGDSLFVQLCVLRKIKKIVIGSTKDEVVTIPVTYMCAKCGHINNEFLPNDEETSKEEPEKEEPKPSIILQ